MAHGNILRKSGEVVEYSHDMINEIIKCNEDIIYFAEKYYTIVTIDKGKQNITLWDWQKKVLKSFVETPNGKQNLILRIARQSGKCVYRNQKIKIRNKKTGEIEEILIEDFYKKNKK